MAFNLKRYLGGKKAQKEGKSFELKLIDMAHLEGWASLHIKPAARPIKTPVGLKLIFEKSTIDHVFGKNGKAIFLDAKTCEAKTFCKSLIKQHQLDKLLEFERNGFATGYLVYFRKQNEICFFSAKILSELLVGKSLRPADGYSLGPLEDFRFSKIPV